MSWILSVGNIDVEFLGTKNGALGVKFNSSKQSGSVQVYAPSETDKEIKPYNVKQPQKDFYDTRYSDGKNFYRADEIDKKYFDKAKPEVFIGTDEMQKMYPTTKKAKVISKQPMSKLNLKNISASDGYYLLPNKEYENIQKYKKLVEYLGDDFVVTSPIRLRVGSTTDHNYAIFVDKSQKVVVAIEVLAKSGMQNEPDF